MIIQLRLSLKDEYIPLDYRPFIMSFIKGALYKEYKNVFDDFYNKDKIKPKSFTFSVNLGKCEFQKDRIKIESKKFSVFLSSYDYSTIMYFYNSFLLRRNQSMPTPLGNSVSLSSCRIIDTKEITNNEIKIKFLSPLLIRNKTEDKDYYLCPSDFDYNKYLNIVVENFLATIDDTFDNKEIELIPIAYKKTIIKNMKLMFPGSLGTFILKGDPKVLTYLHESGLGSRRGEGFGMFKIIDNE